eukprot:CAMPEP_0114571690 /NCGR_PEP_ID=MMETSP0114-20121206/17874_1 /TAXON_ID=31324 /ORGANISM="Goniomonas sp, Strain m" /LENGTH=652 /DNA_ID=CAMNT_0001758813 /DNA_START=29 /DNA_END=1987 /DNA_ORIENTATION=-
MMVSARPKPLTADEINTARRQFMQFDILNSGKISTNELAALMIHIGGDGPEVDYVLSQVDSFGKRFTLDEFIDLLGQVKSLGGGRAVQFKERRVPGVTHTPFSSLNDLMLNCLFLHHPKRLRKRMSRSGKPVEWCDMDLVREPESNGPEVPVPMPQILPDKECGLEAWQAAIPKQYRERQINFVMTDDGRLTPMPFDEQDQDDDDEELEDCFTPDDDKVLDQVFHFYCSVADMFKKGSLGSSEMKRLCVDCGLFGETVSPLRPADVDAACFKIKGLGAKHPSLPPPPVQKSQKKSTSYYQLSFAEFKLVLRLVSIQLTPPQSRKFNIAEHVRILLDQYIFPNAQREAFTNPHSQLLAKELEDPDILEVCMRFRWPLQKLFDFYSDMDDSEDVDKLANLDADAAGAAFDTMSQVEYLRFCRNFELDTYLPLSLRLRAFRSSCYDSGPLAHENAIEFTNFLHCLLRIALLINPVSDPKIQNCVTSSFPSTCQPQATENWPAVSALWGYEPQPAPGHQPMSRKWNLLKTGQFAAELQQAPVDNDLTWPVRRPIASGKSSTGGGITMANVLESMDSNSQEAQDILTQRLPKAAKPTGIWRMQWIGNKPCQKARGVTQKPAWMGKVGSPRQVGNSPPKHKGGLSPKRVHTTAICEPE